MAKNRTGRVGEQIKKELSVLIQKELKDPRIGFVTVTGVDVTSDLSQAKVYLSVFGDDEKKSESLEGAGEGKRIFAHRARQADPAAPYAGADL